MPAAEMMSGTIIGEINRLIISVFAGMFGRDKPSAAKVPSVVDKSDAKKAMITLFQTAPCQFKIEKVKSGRYSTPD